MTTRRYGKTRIAPTPSGFIHLGNVLSFAITAGLAAKTKAKIVLRIDDLDRERVNKEYVRDIFDTLDFLGIPWDEGPVNFREYQTEYSQVHRMNLYRETLEQLRENGDIFACSCSRAGMSSKSLNGGYPGTCRDKDIPPGVENTSWRLRTSRMKAPLRVRTLMSGIVETELPASMREFIVRRKNGLPSYQLASLADDIHFGVNLVVRGEDLWDSTLAQLALASRLPQCEDFGQIVFHHHPLLTGPEGAKLSKSAGATSIRYLRKQGKKPAAVYSLIASMLGIKTPVRNRQSLAAAVMDGGNHAGSGQLLAAFDH